MSLVVFDCETNGLLEELDTVHSLVLRDYLTGQVVASCADQPGYKPISHGLSLLSEADKMVAHNGIAFDIEALQKVYPRWTFQGKVFDTLVAARTRWAHIKETDFALWRRGKLPGHLIGLHSLEAWGCRMGIKKYHTDITDWSKWTPQMQERCERDTVIPREIIIRLKRAQYSKEATDAEMELAWILAAMERGGWPFDIEKAQQLQAILAGKRENVAQKLRETFGQFFVPNGKPKVAKRGNKKRGIEAGVEYQNIKLIDFNPGSRQHISGRLITKYGWNPTEFGNDGKPTVDEGTLKGLPYPEIPDLLEYLMLDKRLGQLAEGKEAWLKVARSDAREGGRLTGLHHIHGYINSGGTVTHRASHSHPNIAQVPKVGKPFGAECRELFAVPNGWYLVGADMSGLELRCLAHYMAKWDDMAYGRTILEGKNEDGTDIHSVNMRVLTLEGKLGRDKAKTWFYAYLYGAGDAKLGWILDPSLSEDAAKVLGKEARRKFEGGLPALGYLIDALKEKCKSQGYINLIDGRRAYVRSEHAVLNTLLQGTGGVLCKWWKVESHKRITAEIGPMGWDRNWFRPGWIHDEVQDGARTLEHAEFIARTEVESAEYMTTRFNFRCPLTGEAKIGRNWKETH